MSIRPRKQRLAIENLEDRALLHGDLGNVFRPPVPPDRPDPPVIICRPVPVPIPYPNVAGLNDRHPGNNLPGVQCPADELIFRALQHISNELSRANDSLSGVLEKLGDPSEGVPDAVQAVLQRINDRSAHVVVLVGDFLGDEEEPPAEGAADEANNRLMGDGSVRGVVIRLEIIARRLMGVDRSLAAILHRMGQTDDAPSERIVEVLNTISATATQVQEQVAPFLNTTEDPNDDPGDPGNGMGDGNNLPGPIPDPRPDDPGNTDHPRPVALHLRAVRAVVERTGDAVDHVIDRIDASGDISADVKAALQLVSDNAQAIADTANGLLDGSVDPAGSAGANLVRPPLPPIRPAPLARHLRAIALILDRTGHHLDRIAAVLEDKPELLEASREALQSIAANAEEIVTAVAPYLADAPGDPSGG